MPNWLTKVGQFIVKAAEGQPREGPWLLPVSGGWLPANVGDKWNWWQLGYNIEPFQPSAMVEACVSAYAQTVAMCPGDHWLADDKGGRERITTSDLCRIIRKPNYYQSISDFLLHTVRSIYLKGNSYAVALRNDRNEVTELHPMDAEFCRPWIAETGDIFYEIGGNQVIESLITDRLIENKIFVPQRDILHIRLNVNRQYPVPLIGESPLVALAREMALNDAAAAQQVGFYMNQARPGAVLATDMVLTKEQVETIRLRWNEQSKGMGTGGTPILTQGLKPVAMPTMSAEDMQLANMLKLSDQRIAMVFRIPLAILGISGSPASSTEVLMQQWIASGLGFILNHIEEAWGNFFKLKGQPDEYLEFNTAALLRSAFTQRVEGFARGVQTGIFSPNEARAEFEKPAVKDGDEPRVQQQVVPLSAAEGIPAAPPSPGPPSAPAAPPKPVPSAPKKVMKDDNLRIRRRFNASRERHISL